MGRTRERVRSKEGLKAHIFDIQRYSISDGPGIRTTVFFKGCPLKCIWCDNPESQHPHPQLFFFESLCVKCNRCVSVCPNQAIDIKSDNSISIRWERCQACGACVKACLSEARAITGKLMTVDEVLQVVKRDSLFYRNSGGGVTASGGEATTQADFLIELFRRCQESGINTALETSGCVRWDILKKILKYTDLTLYDIKHMDTKKHIKLTGVNNSLILRNAERVAQSGTQMRIRLPLIPGCNDSRENIRLVAEFVVTRLGFKEVDIIPYHQLGVRKYERLGETYQLDDLKPYKEEQVEAVKQVFESYGLKAVIV